MSLNSQRHFVRSCLIITQILDQAFHLTFLTQGEVNALLALVNLVSGNGLRELFFYYFTDKETEFKIRKLQLYRVVFVELQTEHECPTFKIRSIFGTAVSFKLTR